LFTLNEEVVIENCHILQEAVEEWATENGTDEYPNSLSQETPLGISVYDLLPNGELLLNPYTGYLSEPQNDAVRDGDVGYLPRSDGTPGVPGYLIIGIGENGRQVLVLEN